MSQVSSPLTLVGLMMLRMGWGRGDRVLLCPEVARAEAQRGARGLSRVGPTRGRGENSGAGLGGPSCAPQIKLGVGLEQGSPFAVWTRPPKTILGPCDQEQVRPRPPGELKVGLNLGVEEGGYLACWDQGVSTKDQEQSLDPPQARPQAASPLHFL